MTLWLWNIVIVLLFLQWPGQQQKNRGYNIFGDKVYRKHLEFLQYNASGKVLNDNDFFPFSSLALIRSAVGPLFIRSPGNCPLTVSCSRSKYKSRYAASHGHGEMIHTTRACTWTWKAPAWLSSSQWRLGMMNSTITEQCSPETGTLFRTAASHTQPTRSPLTFCVISSLCSCYFVWS